MNIIILGSGKVGGNLATHLVNEDNNITIVDTDPRPLKALQERLDVNTVMGQAAHPSVLISAGIEEADMLIAVTGNDETNMIACQVAYTLFRTPTKIARIRESQYTLRKKLFGNNALPIDVIISPEQLITYHIRKLIEQPGALQVFDFAHGNTVLIATKAKYGAITVGKSVQFLLSQLTERPTHITAIFRHGEAIIPDDDTIIEHNDEVFFTTQRKDVEAVLSNFCLVEKKYKKIMIAGGGHIGARLAESLELTHDIKIIDRSQSNIDKLALNLNHSIILHGDATDLELLQNEQIYDMDMFCSITNSDETNILSAMLAKKNQVRKTLALINKTPFIDVVEGNNIDIVVSPQQITLSRLLAFLRRGDIVSVHALRRGSAEVIEMIAHGTEKTSRVIGRSVQQINLPPGSNIAGIIREKNFVLPKPHERILPEDHVIIFLVDKQYVKHIERLFEVALTFF